MTRLFASLRSSYFSILSHDDDRDLRADDAHIRISIKKLHLDNFYMCVSSTFAFAWTRRTQLHSCSGATAHFHAHIVLACTCNPFRMTAIRLKYVTATTCSLYYEHEKRRRGIQGCNVNTITTSNLSLFAICAPLVKGML